MPPVLTDPASQSAVAVFENSVFNKEYFAEHGDNDGEADEAERYQQHDKIVMKMPARFHVVRRFGTVP